MPTHIQIGDVTPRVQYTADGTQTVFTYPFPIFKDEDLQVYLEDTKQSAGYTVSGAGVSSGGSVTFDVAPLVSVTVTVARRIHVHDSVRTTPIVIEMREWRPASRAPDDGLDAVAGCLLAEPVRLPRNPNAHPLGNRPNWTGGGSGFQARTNFDP